MERALQLIEPYTRREGVLGIYLVGSASRPFRDAVSDYDFEVAVEDAVHDAAPVSDRHVFAMDPDVPGRVDYEFLLRPWSELEGLVDSTRDLDHAPFRHAKVLFDPSGALAPLLERLAHLPDEVRETRARVHYFEVLASARRASKCFDRGAGALDTRLMAGDAVAAFAKLLFVLRGSWPAMRHWAREELAEAGVAPALLQFLERLLTDPDRGGATRIVEEARRELDERGLDFHRDVAALRTWAFLTPEGRAAFLAWGSR